MKPRSYFPISDRTGSVKDQYDLGRCMVLALLE
jgi:hypothetical protein